MRVRRFLRRTDMPVTRFGREAAGDPRLLRDIANGRQLGPKLTARIAAYLDRMERDQGAGR